MEERHQKINDNENPMLGLGFLSFAVRFKSLFPVSPEDFNTWNRLSTNTPQLSPSIAYLVTGKDRRRRKLRMDHEVKEMTEGMIIANPDSFTVTPVNQSQHSTLDVGGNGQPVQPTEEEPMLQRQGVEAAPPAPENEFAPGEQLK